MAAQTLTPNKMSRGGVDAEGNPKPGNKLLPLIEDRWDFMGACLRRMEVRHRTDHCPGHRSWLKARVFGLGMPYQPLEAEAPKMDNAEVVPGVDTPTIPNSFGDHV
jgi:hypothetical protein